MAQPSGNFSMAWAGSVVNDAAAGTLAWSNASNAKLQDAAYATASHAGGDESQYIKATTFPFYPAIPADATIVGFSPVIKGKRSVAGTAVTDAEAKFIVAGSITGSSFATGSRQLGSPAGGQRNTLWYGRDAGLLGGLTPAPSDLTNDTDFGFAWRSASAGAVDAQIDAMGMVVWWTKTAACTIEALSPTTGQPDHTFIWMSAISSYIGTSKPSHVGYEWECTQAPEGWSQTWTDPRRGATINGVTRDCRRDMRGRVVGVYADIAGTYKFRCRQTLEDGTVGAWSSVLTFVIDAFAGTTYHLKPSTGSNGNTGLSEAQAWATWAYTIANAGNDCRVLIYDDETVSITGSAPSKASWTRAHITRSGTGTNPPTFDIAAGLSVASLTADTDVVFDSINFGNYGSTLTAADWPNCISGHTHARLAIVDSTALKFSSILEITATGNSEQLAIVRSNVSARRYVIYADGQRVRYVATYGSTVASLSSTGGEAMFRLAAVTPADQSYGIGANIFGNSVSNGQPSGSFTYTAANPTVCTQSNHGLTTGSSVTVSGSTGTSLNGARTVTVVDKDTFTIPVNVATPGSASFTTVPQTYIRPGWSFVDSWGNRVNGLGYAFSEGADSAEIMSFMLGNRFDMEDFTGVTGYAYTNQRNALGLLFASCVVDNIDVWLNIIAYDSQTWFRWHCCTIMPPAASTSQTFIEATNSGSPGDPYGIGVRSCLFVAGASWNSSWVRDSTSVGYWSSALGMEFSHNVYNKGASTNWRNANTALNLAAWNALDAVDSEVAESTLTQADVASTTDFLPDAGFTNARGNGVPEPGVIWDFRGVRRDHAASTWSAGATGEETLPSAPSISCTPGDTENVITTPALGSNVRHVVYFSLTPGGPYNYAGEVTSGTTFTHTGLSNGITYYYVAATEDDLYNRSADSTEASGTPAAATPPDAPVILSVARTSATQAVVRVVSGWTRLIVYYPDTAGIVVWDSDDPEDAATVVTFIDGYDEFTVDLPGEAGINDAVPFEATDTSGVSESLPTGFTVPPLRRGGGVMGGGALVGFGGL